MPKVVVPLESIVVVKWCDSLDWLVPPPNIDQLLDPLDELLPLASDIFNENSTRELELKPIAESGLYCGDRAKLAEGRSPPVGSRKRQSEKAVYSAMETATVESKMT